MRTRQFFERITDNWPAKILSIVAATLLFLFYRTSTLQERYISVPLHIATSQSLVAMSSIPDSVRVTLRGKADTIFLVHEENIDARLDLRSYKNAGVYRVPIKVTRTGATANADFEMKVDPLQLTVTLEKRVEKSVKVVANITGFTAKGYELGQYFLSPDHLQLSGPQSSVNAIDSVKTDPVNLDGKTGDFTERVGLSLPSPKVKVVGNEMVEFHGVVRQIVVVRTIEPVDVVALDLEPSLHMQLSATTGRIQVQGSQLVLENLKQGDATLDVECSKITKPGTYTVQTKPSVPRGFLVLNYSPQKVTLTITKGGTGQ